MSLNKACARFFVVAAIIVLAFALLVVVLPGEVEAKRVAAKKIDVSGVGRAGSALDSALKIQPPQHKGIPPCTGIQGIIDDYLPCNGGEVIGDTVIVGPRGHLDVIGNQLRFSNAHTLTVRPGGQLTLRENVRVMLSPRSFQGYIIISEYGSTISFTNTEISDARQVLIGSQEALLSRVKYYSNEQALVLAGSNALVEDSEFYDNNNAGLVLQARDAVIKRNKFYKTTGGAQENGVVFQGIVSGVTFGGSAPSDGNEIYDNSGTGLLLDVGHSNSIQNNVIHGNGEAGIRFNWLPPFEEGGGLDNWPWSVNIVRGNNVYGNRDGLIDYMPNNDVNAAQAALLHDNQNYGLVSIDTDAHADVEASVGSGNALGKAAHLHSKRVAANKEHGLPPNVVYVTFCNHDTGDCNQYMGLENKALHYENYAQPYRIISRGTPYWYFVSDLEATEARGNYKYTPWFLTLEHTVTAQVNPFCGTAGNECNARAVTDYSPGGGFGGTEYYPNINTKLVEITMWDGQFKQPKQQPQKTGGKRPAVKVSSVPVLNAVTTPPRPIPAVKHVG